MCIRDREAALSSGEVIALKNHPHPTSKGSSDPVSYTHLRAHETVLDRVCRLLLETKRRPPRSTRVRSSAASDVYKRQGSGSKFRGGHCTKKSPPSHQQG